MIVPFVDIVRLFNQNNTTCLASGTGTAYTSRTLEFTPGFQWGSLCSIFCFLCIIRSLFVCLSFFLGHCVVCLSSISGFLYYPVGISKLFLMTIPGSISIHKIEIYNGCHQMVRFTQLLVISVDHCLSRFLWPLHCLLFFNLQILITPLVSSNFPYNK